MNRQRVVHNNSKRLILDTMEEWIRMYPPLTKLKETEARINSWIHSEKHLAIVLKETGELLGYLVIHPEKGLLSYYKQMID